MELTIENYVPDVYGQRQLIDGMIQTAFREGEGPCKVRVVEPADSVEWLFTLTGEDGVTRGPVVVSVEDQLDYDLLATRTARRLQHLLAV